MCFNVYDFDLQAFVAVLSLLALAAADQVHHQAVKLGNAPTVTTTISKAHGSHAAAVHSQPSAQPSEVNQYHNEEKYEAGNIAPVSPYANKPVRGYNNPAPIYHPAPAYKPRTYSFKPVTEAPVEKAAEEAAPAAEEAAEEAAPAVEEAAEE